MHLFVYSEQKVMSSLFSEKQGWGVNEIRLVGRVQVNLPGDLSLPTFTAEVIATGDVPASLLCL